MASLWARIFGRTQADAAPKPRRHPGVVLGDAWYNETTGLGTSSRDKTIQYRLGRLVLSDDALETLYADDDMAARICDLPGDEALRNGFECRVDGDPEASTALAAKQEELGTREKLVDASSWSRCYGGAAILVGAEDGQPPEQPLALDRVRSVDFLTVLTRRELWAHRWYGDATKPKYGTPETYWLRPLGAPSGGGGVLVHESRLLVFGGVRAVPQRRVTLQGFGESVLLRCYDALRQFGACWQSITNRVQDFSQGVWKMRDLWALMATPTGKEDLRKRLEALDMGRSVGRVLPIDAELEDFFYRDANMSQLPELLDRFMIRLSAITGIPVTRLWGMAPAGMNATGESDARGWYDFVVAYQNFALKPHVDRMTRLLLVAGGREEPAKWFCRFPHPWQPTETDKAELYGKYAQADAQYVDRGVLTAEEVARSRFRPEGFSTEAPQVDLDAREAEAEPEPEAPAGPNGAEAMEPPPSSPSPEG